MPSISNTTVSPYAVPAAGVWNSVAIARATGEGLYVDVFYGYEWGSTDLISEVRWDPTGDNQLMTLVQDQEMNTNRRFATFWLPNPTSVKSGSIRVTFAGTVNDGCWMRVSCVLGHDGGAVVGSAKRSEPDPNANDLSITLAAAVGELVIASIVMRNATSLFTNGNLDGYLNSVINASLTAMHGTRPGAASVTATVIYADSTNYDNAIIAARIGAGAEPAPALTGPSGPTHSFLTQGRLAS